MDDAASVLQVCPEGFNTRRGGEAKEGEDLLRTAQADGATFDL